MTAFQRGSPFSRSLLGCGLAGFIELERAAGIGLDVSSTSMASAVMLGKVVFVGVMIATAYGVDARVDYPNLAGKANQR